MKAQTVPRKKRQTKKRETTTFDLSKYEVALLRQMEKLESKPPARRNPHPFADIGAL